MPLLFVDGGCDMDYGGLCCTVFGLDWVLWVAYQKKKKKRAQICGSWFYWSLGLHLRSWFWLFNVLNWTGPNLDQLGLKCKMNCFPRTNLIWALMQSIFFFFFFYIKTKTIIYLVKSFEINNEAIFKFSETFLIAL